MRKIIKYTSVISLWLAGLAFIAHLLLPHDHHIADTFSNQDKNCPASNDKSNHHPVFPVHCHVLNDLASEKTINYFISKYIQSDYKSAGEYPDAFSFDFPVSGGTITDKQEPFPVYNLPGLSPLRAPPSLI